MQFPNGTKSLMLYRFSWALSFETCQLTFAAFDFWCWCQCCIFTLSALGLESPSTASFTFWKAYQRIETGRQKPRKPALSFRHWCGVHHLRTWQTFQGSVPTSLAAWSVSPGVIPFKILPCPIRDRPIPGMAGDSGILHGHISHWLRHQFSRGIIRVINLS